MKETVRVILNGNLSEFRKAWEARTAWPFGDYGTAQLPSDSAERALLHELAPHHPIVRYREFVERQYSKKELLTFNTFVLWINGEAETNGDEGFEYGTQCPQCGFPSYRRRVEPLNLRLRPKKDLSLTDDWEIVLSGRVANRLEDAGLQGYSLSPVLVKGQPTDFRVLGIETDLGQFLPTSLRYDGPACPKCGRYDRYYPIHPSKELWLPQEHIPRTDFAHLNARLERTFNYFKLMSHRAYATLLDLKATGWWVQPVHTTDG